MTAIAMHLPQFVWMEIAEMVRRFTPILRIGDRVPTFDVFWPKHLQEVGWLVGWLVGCFGFNDPLRQYFSLYRAVSQREGERGQKG